MRSVCLAATYVTLVWGASLPGAAQPPAPQPGPQVAQPAGEDGPPVALTRDEVQRRIDTLPGLQLDEPVAKEAAERYARALGWLAEADQQRAAQRRRQQNLEGRSRTEAKVRDALSSDPETPEAPKSAELGALEQDIAELEQMLKRAQAELAKFEDRPKQRAARLASIPQEVALARARIDEVTEILEAGALAAEPVVADAQRVELHAERVALEERVASLQLEQQICASGSPLLQLQHDLWARNVAVYREALEAARARANEVRRLEVQEQAASAAEDAGKSRPGAIAALADANAQIAASREQLADRIAKLEHELDASQQQLATLEREFNNNRKRVEEASLSEAAGQLLRQQMGRLPDAAAINRAIHERHPERGQALFEQYQDIDRRGDLTDLDDEVEKALASLEPPERAVWRGEARKLLVKQREFLEGRNSDYDKFLTTLANLNATQQTLVDTTEAYRAFITERVLWIRSCAPPTASDYRPASDAARWSLSPSNWGAAGAALWAAASAAPVRTAGQLVLLLGLLILQHRARSRVRAAGEEASKRTCVRFAPTLDALVGTAVIAIPWPLLIWLLGVWLEGSAAPAAIGDRQGAFVSALGASLRAAAACFLLVELLRHVCRIGGLAERHFDWPPAALHQARRALRVLAMFALPLLIWLVGLEAQRIAPLWSSSLGRLLFILVQLLLTYLLWRLLLERRSPFRQHLGARRGAGGPALSNAWRPALVALPAVLIALALAGYYYSAQWLTAQATKTVALALGMALLGGVVRRWLLVNHRRLAREQAQARRAQLAQTPDTEGTLPPIELADEQADIAALSQQTKELTSTLLLASGVLAATYFWWDVVPAIGHLGSTPVVPGLAQITWSQLLLACATAAVTYVSVRDVPALAELLVLRRLPLDAGARYALSAVCRYVLLGIGVALTFRAIGFRGEQVQWLVAAMGVGLGFGLQEIFANFVSGIILLFERPIRVGDIVTLGETTGTVSRIRIRATTIVDWDRKEYVVPNKDLVTERLLNWTLSDHVTRITLRVGVEYGADPEQACDILTRVALSHPNVQREPAPVAFLDGFGDSTLNLGLHCFLPGPETRLKTTHDLYTAIYREFGRADIEIAFPQLDLNIRRLPEGLAPGPWAPNGAAASPPPGSPNRGSGPVK